MVTSHVNVPSSTVCSPSWPHVSPARGHVPDDVGDPRVSDTHHEDWDHQDNCEHVKLEPFTERWSIYVVFVTPVGCYMQSYLPMLLEIISNLL